MRGLLEFEEMPEVDFEGAIEWISTKRVLLEWILWRGKQAFVVKHENGRWKGVGKGNMRKNSLAGRPSKVKVVAEMDLTGFLEKCAKNGEGVRAICRRLEAFLRQRDKLHISPPSGIGVAHVTMVSGGTTRRVIGRLVMKKLLTRLDNGLYVKGPLAPEPPVPNASFEPSVLLGDGDPPGYFEKTGEPHETLERGTITPPVLKPVESGPQEPTAAGPPTCATCKVPLRPDWTCPTCANKYEPQSAPEPPSAMPAVLEQAHPMVESGFDEVAPAPPTPLCPTCKVRLDKELVCPSCAVEFVMREGRLGLKPAAAVVPMRDASAALNAAFSPPGVTIDVPRGAKSST